MTSFRVRDLTINVTACDRSINPCYNAASIRPPEEDIGILQAKCDTSTIECFNAASIHPSRALELVAAFKCDGSTVACLNAASVHPPEIVRAAVPTSAAPEELEAWRTELRNALARLDPGGVSSSEAPAPRTLAEVEMLQGKLSDALADLNAQRQALQQGGDS
jgi:hypothetical protein